MPELPEVETIARGVDERLRGDRIVDVWFGSHSEPFKTLPDRQLIGLLDKVILQVHRVGKHIVCELGGPESEGPTAQWIVHLGMTGRLLVTTPEGLVEPHTHARLTLASGREMRFVDPRRFGRLEFREMGEEKPFTGPGTEPLTISPEAFAVLFRGRRLAIKAALLNQSLLHGVGNIYADESLFRAGIRPKRMAGRLKRAELFRLHAALREVLLHAIELGGSSVSDYVDADGVRGFFQLEHRVYLRTGEPCLVCATPIRRILLAGRGTHYCPVCQR
ncbi:bifunctional DNA-formamidopyrimidine glycosylase/DNA-(apurinic or apyrimidinic site) lyase [Acidicapsa acidisoli]|uniref:bifunctional DNA-formamidopyrimidine glycosylase/DNA-(apurinic or apyrimidinic site) lyase n=1 Tax=Acidicapsa acidisoli TaxID=1615681 RepID=UPI0021DFE7A6|nr:bifunctional DNA-formamidopyrimidine glycosylase/DNA-(apurinic or apyrimidinic site) lyase [Acidicapsa acidisoli]